MAMGAEFDAIVRAALDGKEDELKALVAGGADLNQYDSIGQTPLLRIVFIGAADAAELLLRHGADPTRAHRYDPSSTPLWHASNEDFGLHEIEVLLLRFGARRE
jgi:ankyrin repeat protein